MPLFSFLFDFQHRARVHSQAAHKKTTNKRQLNQGICDLRKLNQSVFKIRFVLEKKEIKGGEIEKKIIPFSSN